MSPKRSKRSQAAQQLIENLLDELPSSKAPSSPNDELSMGDGSFGPVDPESDHNIVFENDDSEAANFSLEGSVKPKAHLDPVAQAQKTAAEQHSKRLSEQETRIGAPPAPSTVQRSSKAPPFEGDSPVVTKMVRRDKIVKPPASEIVREERARPEADVDFGQMSANDPFDVPAPAPDVAGSTRVDAPFAPPLEDERTMRMPSASTLASPPEPREPTRSEVIQGDFKRSIDRGGATEIRAGIKIPPSPKFASNSNSAPTSIEAALKQSESLRIAQDRMIELERELERVRRDNEALSTAGDTLRRRADELAGRAEALEIRAREADIRLEEEKKVLRGQLQQKERDNSEMRSRVEEIETRLESNFKKIRVRERELEHRLEIVKMENATLISTKDKMLLDLKRQIDQLHQESDSAKSKSQELFSQYKEKQETIRRVVRALRIALTILEGDDENLVPMKKAE